MADGADAGNDADRVRQGSRLRVQARFPSPRREGLLAAQLWNEQYMYKYVAGCPPD